MGPPRRVAGIPCGRLRQPPLGGRRRGRQPLVRHRRPGRRRRTAHGVAERRGGPARHRPDLRGRPRADPRRRAALRPRRLRRHRLPVRRRPELRLERVPRPRPPPGHPGHDHPAAHRAHNRPPARPRRRLRRPRRGEIEAALKAPGPDCGPYARLAAELLAGHREALAGLLARYDELVLDSHGEPVRAVLTHGEPHSGNTMLTPSGWRLIDWDTVLISPPERDLWLIEPGDGSIFSAYAAATGVLPRPSTIMLYQLRWALTDIAVEVRRFRRPHTGTADDLEGWEILRSVVTRI
ncbi:phosphotransferase family protein [Dactylosporangium cerinum]